MFSGISACSFFFFLLRPPLARSQLLVLSPPSSRRTQRDNNPRNEMRLFSVLDMSILHMEKKYELL